MPSVGVSNPLPLSLITFNAGTETDKISLNWVISNQQTYKYFTIEKEFPSGSFQSLSWINISQSTDNQQYNAIDPNPIVGKNRYRLRLTGMNGEIIFSEIATIIFKGQQQVIAYPNPAREKIFIKIPKSSSISEIAIVHISGSVIKWLKTSNQTALDVDIRDITRGIYYIKIIQAGYSTVIPIIKY